MGDRMTLEAINCAYCGKPNYGIWYAPTSEADYFTCNGCKKCNFITSACEAKKLEDTTDKEVYDGFMAATSVAWNPAEDIKIKEEAKGHLQRLKGIDNVESITHDKLAGLAVEAQHPDYVGQEKPKQVEANGIMKSAGGGGTKLLPYAMKHAKANTRKQNKFILKKLKDYSSEKGVSEFKVNDFAVWLGYGKASTHHQTLNDRLNELARRHILTITCKCPLTFAIPKHKARTELGQPPYVRVQNNRNHPTNTFQSPQRIRMHREMRDEIYTKPSKSSEGIPRLPRTPTPLLRFVKGIPATSKGIYPTSELVSKLSLLLKGETVIADWKVAGYKTIDSCYASLKYAIDNGNLKGKVAVRKKELYFEKG